MSGVPECDKALERLLPRIGPPSVAECDSMACSELCRRRQNTASGPRTEQQIDRRKDWISIANKASPLTMCSHRLSYCRLEPYSMQLAVGYGGRRLGGLVRRSGGSKNWSAAVAGSSGSAESSSARSTIPRISWALFNSPASLSSSGDFEIGSSHPKASANRDTLIRREARTPARRRRSPMSLAERVISDCSITFE